MHNFWKTTLSNIKYIKDEPTAITETKAAVCMLDIRPATDDIVFSCVEKSIFPNAIAMFKKVKRGPKPVNIVGIVCTNLLLNFEVTRAKVESRTVTSKMLEGQIGYISPVAEFTPKTVQSTDQRANLVYKVRVYINNKDDFLRQGMPITVKVNLKSI